MKRKEVQGTRRSLIVQKFGGTSVGSLERIEKSARIILDKWKMGSDPVVVVSAMSGETNRLEGLARGITHHENAAMDMILSSGEQVSVGLMSLMLDRMAKEEGLIEADESLAEPTLAHQLPIGTHSKRFADAKIDYINHAKVHETAAKGKITVLPGYQAFNGEKVMTLGRGGSDTSAVSIAGLIGADLCEIYTDVDGIYSTDPRVCKDALKYDILTTEEMKLLSMNGAKVMHHKAIQAAHEYRVPVVVKSSFDPTIQGTLIVHPDFAPDLNTEEDSQIYGVTALKDVMVVDVPDREGLEQKLVDNLQLVSLTRKNSEKLQVILDSKHWEHLIELVESEEVSLDRPKDLYAKINILGENLDNEASEFDEALEKALDGSKNTVKGVVKTDEIVSFLVNREVLSEVTKKIHDSCLSMIGKGQEKMDQAKILMKAKKREVSYGQSK